MFARLKNRAQTAECDSACLRRFGISAAVIIAGSGLFIPLFARLRLNAWLFVTAAAFLLSALLIPASLRLLHKGWMVFALTLGKINSTILLSILYFCVITPAGIIFRLTGYDPLKRKKGGEGATFRTTCTPLPPHTMEKPY